ncbi:PilZ domain-containing protein [Erythrobacter sp.]|uniref:PilZ domain-containing protein n=1 Tax=Erythrobacter sp. TaxID=1042 RepID=UPI002EB0D920|nr:PilZ domain-containing protein [Erythrobacter sp.]
MADPEDRPEEPNAAEGARPVGSGRGPDAALGGFDRDGADQAAAGLPPIANTGRRSAARLRVSLPARLISIEGERACVLVNLSRTGAMVAVEGPVRVGENAVLSCAELEAFGEVVRADGGLYAMRFDDPISEAEVIAIRRLYDNFEERERRSLVDTVRDWVTGESGDERLK